MLAAQPVDLVFRSTYNFYSCTVYSCSRLANNRANIFWLAAVRHQPYRTQLGASVLAASRPRQPAKSQPASGSQPFLIIAREP